MIAALYVDELGPYYERADVDTWPIDRDARRYAGPHPVVAHPPCSTWCHLASVNHARWGYPIGEDDGCFEAALAAVRKFGGVLEHPAYSLAWSRYALPPPYPGSWQQSLLDPGYVTQVSQSAYGHPARKRTWLYYVGPPPPALNWSDQDTDAAIGACVHSGRRTSKRRLSRAEAIQTPAAFRDLLINLAQRTTERTV